MSWLNGVLVACIALYVGCAPQLTAAPVQTTATRSLTLPSKPRAAILVQPETAALPLEWLPDRGRECIRKGVNRGFCAGPRRVPRPFGAPAALASELGLGDRLASARLLLAPPSRSWVTEAKQIHKGEWVWPVDPKGFVRGLGDIRKAIRRRRAMAKPHPDPAVVHPAHHEHEGIDLAAPEGTPIRAAQSGLVVYSDNEIRGYGNLVILLHPDSSVTFYAHCRATFVFPGQEVNAGQVIGEVGLTGFTQGPHLHFEYRVAGMPRDPQPLFHRSKRQPTRAIAKRNADTNGPRAQASIKRARPAHHSE